MDSARGSMQSLKIDSWFENVNKFICQQICKILIFDCKAVMSLGIELLLTMNHIIDVSYLFPVPTSLHCGNSFDAGCLP